MPDDQRFSLTSANAALEPGQRIAVVGSGISGLMSAYLLGRHHQVVLFEADSRLGGHANTVMAPCRDGDVAVDTGFIVYNEPNYPQLCALFDHLGVETAPSDMSFAASLDDGALGYSGSGLNGLFAQRSNILNPRHWGFIRDLVRFYRQAPALLSDPAMADASLGDLLQATGASDHFARSHVLPMAAAIWSTPAQAVMDFPARSYLRFFDNHGLFRLANRIPWRTVKGGSARYVETLAKAFRGDVRVSSPAVWMRRDLDGVWLKTPGGEPERFDAIVMATHADQALAVLDMPDGRERDALGAFQYEPNTAVLHRDARLMPKRRRAWSSWNYLSSGPAEAPRLALSYWMNKLQPLPTQEDLIVTLNPDEQPADVISTQHYTHPIFDAAAMAAQSQVMAMQGHRNTYYAGAHLGYGFHEDGAQSAVAVARLLGAPAPWDSVADPMPLSRIAA